MLQRGVCKIATQPTLAGKAQNNRYTLITEKWVATATSSYADSDQMLRSSFNGRYVYWRW